MHYFVTQQLSDVKTRNVSVYVDCLSFGLYFFSGGFNLVVLS